MNNPPPNPYQAPGYPPAFGYFTPQAPQPPSYEFSPAENVVLADAALWLRILAVTSFVEAVVELVPKDRNAVGAGMSILIGILLLNAAKSFRAVVDTEGQDVPQLMQALETVGNVLMMRIVMAILGILMVLLVIVLVVAFLAFLVQALKP